MRKKIDKIHEKDFEAYESQDAIDKMNKWIEDNPDDIVVINVQIDTARGERPIPMEGTEMTGVEVVTRWIYRLFYGIKNKEV